MPKKNNTFTLGAVAVAVLLGGYMYFVESKQQAPVDSKDVAIWSLTENQAQDLKRLTVKAEAQEATYVRDGVKWRLAAEPKRDLDGGTWDTAYAAIKSMSATRKLEDHAKDLGVYGLTTPSATLKWGDDKSPYQLEVGAKTPTNDAYYVHSKTDDGIYTVSSWKVDEWKKLASNPPLAALPSPSPSPSAAASPAAAPAAPATAASPDAHPAHP